MVAGSENRLLAALPRAGRRRFVASCDHVPLKLHDILAEAGELIRHVYFPTAGFISLVVALDNGAQLEVGIIGNEGMLGSALALDVGISPQLAIVQGAGTALRMSVPAFRRHCQQNAKLRERWRAMSTSRCASWHKCRHAPDITRWKRVSLAGCS